MMGNNKISLTDTIIGAHGLTGLAAGHPLALVASLGAAVGHHILKTYGDAVGSRILDKLASSGALGQTLMPMVAARAVGQAQRSYGLAVTRGLAALTRGEIASAPPGRPRTIDGDFAEKSQLVKNMTGNPQQYAQQVSSQAKALGPTFTTSATAYERSAMSVGVYLAQQMPKSRPLDPAMPKAGTVEPTKHEKATFNRVFDAVQNPPSLLHSAAKGELTKAEVDAVSVTAPSTLKDLQKQTTAELKTLKRPLAPAVAANVKMLLGQPVIDHPVEIKMPNPSPPPGQQAHGGHRPRSSTSRPLKVDMSTVGLVGSRPSLS
jgi:hypothetical protein